MSIVIVSRAVSQGFNVITRDKMERIVNRGLHAIYESAWIVGIRDGYLCCTWSR